MGRPSPLVGLSCSEERKFYRSTEVGAFDLHHNDRVALVYPSPYRAGMSSLGFQSIYREINQSGDFAADRAFLPHDSLAALNSKSGLYTLETEEAVQNYPLVAFSVAYELELAGLIDCLRLAGIQIEAENRPNQNQLLVAGGPLTFSNPEPLAPFFDIIIMGEGEALFLELCQVARELGYSRQKTKEHFRGKAGFYIPEFDGGDVPAIARAEDRDLPARSQIITPHTELRSMFLIETGRGCSRGCTYCVMRRSTNGGMRPFPPERVLKHIPSHAERVGLVGAAVTDHPQISEIVGPLVDAGREIGISSLRADKLTDSFVGLLAKGGYRTLTVALDAPSQRMRGQIERVTRDEHIFRCAELVKKHGLKTLKIYMIVGLPGETDGDIDELIQLCLALHKVHGKIALGVAPFVAKRHTPLDGTDFFGISKIEKRLQRLRKGLRGQVVVRPTSARWAWVEYMLAQGSRDAGLALMDAHLAGGRFADYKRAFANRGCTPSGPKRRVLSSVEIQAEKRAALSQRLKIVSN